MTHKLDRSVVTATSAPSGNQIWLSLFSRSVFTFQKNVNTPFFFFVNHLFFFFSGLFDWKKDKNFFARFEEPVSPERDSSTDDGELTCFRQTSSFCFYPHCFLIFQQECAGTQTRARVCMCDLNDDRQMLASDSQINN